MPFNHNFVPSVDPYIERGKILLADYFPYLNQRRSGIRLVLEIKKGFRRIASVCVLTDSAEIGIPFKSRRIEEITMNFIWELLKRENRCPGLQFLHAKSQGRYK